MGYIYKITNSINNKVYIGLTNLSNPIDRWTKHLVDYRTATKYSKRPLYEAMNKYGVENFHFEIIEETDNPKEREQYWIKQYNSYIGFENSNGYNATLGGDGLNKKVFSKEEQEIIFQLNKDGYSCNYIATYLEHTSESISKFLKENNLPVKSYKGTAVRQYSKNGDYISTYPSSRAAARNLGKAGHGGHITEACSGKRKTAYGYKWEYAE